MNITIQLTEVEVSKLPEHIDDTAVLRRVIMESVQRAFENPVDPRLFLLAYKMDVTIDGESDVREFVPKGELTEATLRQHLSAHSTRIAEAMSLAMGSLAAATLQAQEIAEDGPTRRLKENLVASCYQIRLRALMGSADDSEPKHKEATTTKLATLALADAEAVLAALGTQIPDRDR